MTRNRRMRTRSERELEARTRQQAAVASLSRRALANPDLAALLDETVALAAGILATPYGLVLAPPPRGEALRLEAGVGWGEESVGRATVEADPTSPAGYTLASGEPVVVADLRAQTRFRVPALFAAHGVVSGVSVVIPGKERPFGVLGAYARRRRRFTPDDVHFLQAAANVLAAAIERRRAEDALRRSERRFRALFEQAPLGLISYAPDGLLLDANRAMLDTLPPRQAVGYNVLEDRRFVPDEMKDDIRRAFAGEAVRLPPLHAAAPTAGGRARWVRSFLYPVKDDGGAVSEVVAMVEDITEQQQAYALLEQRVAERTRELSTLLDVSHDVAATLELQPLLNLILDHLKTVVHYTSAAIFLVEGDHGDHLIPLGYRGPLAPEQVLALRVPIARAVAFQEVIRRRGPLIVDDLRGATPMAQALQAGPGRPWYDTFGDVRALLVAPLMAKERIIGVAGLAHVEPGHYTPHHATLALAVANQAAVAIENARLFARAQELAALEERARLARELHDAVTQTLFSASMIAEVLPRLWERDPRAGRQRLEDVHLLTRGALAEMRTLLLELRPTALTDAQLGDLLRQLVEALMGRKRLPVTLTVDGSRALPPDVQVALYRVAQEALTNVARHARATAVEVCLRSDARGIVLQIGDDGRGFDPARVAADHFGLRIMRERAAAIGATLTVRSRPGGGTRLRMVWRERTAKAGS